VRPAGDPTQHAETLACAEAAKRLSEAALARCTLYTSTEPCAMCAGAIYWIGLGRVVFALAETSLLRYTGSHTENPTLDLPCREVFARGQKQIAVAGHLSWKTRRAGCMRAFGHPRAQKWTEHFVGRRMD
jgi:pyrimidine deaminase RibD-like protein